MSGHLGDLSQVQQQALTGFRARLDPEAKVDDYTCLRFLRARDFDVEASSAMFANFAAWRKREKIDKILEKIPPKYDLYCKFIPHKSHGFDKQGRPLYIEKVGSIDWPTVVNYLTNDELLYIHVWQFELAARKAEESSRKLGKQVETFTSIIDLTDLNLGHRKGLDYTRAFSTLDQLYYPERMGRLFIVNAPRLFPFFWNICKKWIHPNTAAKIEVLGADFAEKLLEYIPADTLPEEYGGTCRCGEKDGKSTGGQCVPVHNVSKLAEAVSAGNAEFDSPYHHDQAIDSRQTWDIKITAGDATNGCLVEWSWNCLSNDIQFSVECIPIGPSRARGDTKGDMLQRESEKKKWRLRKKKTRCPEEDEMEQKFALGEAFFIRPPKRMEHNRSRFRAPVGCTFIFKFDNSYSWLKSKSLRYLVRSETVMAEAYDEDEEVESAGEQSKRGSIVLSPSSSSSLSPTSATPTSVSSSPASPSSPSLSPSSPSNSPSSPSSTSAGAIAAH
jgi:hypothetical protein